MSKAIEPEVIDAPTGIIKFSPAEAALVQMRDNYSALTIKAPDDKPGIAAVARFANNSTICATCTAVKGLPLAPSAKACSQALSTDIR